MRKDVKTGFAIGGVLLAVLVVYILVISGGEKPQQVSLSTTPDSSAPAAQQDNPAPLPATNPSPAVAEGSAPASAPSDVKPAAVVDARPATPAANPPATEPSPAVATASDTGHWADNVLSTGKLPLMVTTTPQPQSSSPMVAVGSANTEPSAASDSSTPPTKTSNAPASVSPIMASDSSSVGSVSRSSNTMQPAIPAAPGQRTHVVQAGETFASIAAAVYGSSAYYPHLIRANATIDPRKLRPGMTINLPDPSEVRADGSSAAAPVAGASPAAASSIDPKTQYQVQPSDSLYRISMKLYGRADMVEKIYDLNKAAIGPDMKKLKLGMVLSLPEAPTAR